MIDNYSRFRTSLFKVLLNELEIEMNKEDGLDKTKDKGGPNFKENFLFFFQMSDIFKKMILLI